MSRRSFTLAQLMGIVCYLALGFAALRNADAFWASAANTLAILLNAASLVGAFVRSGRARIPWVGFTVFGWTYLLMAHLPGDPPLLVEWAAARLQPYIKPMPQGMSGDAASDFLIPYEQVAQSLGIILFGLLGAVLGPLLAAKDERSDRRTVSGEP